MDDNTPHFMLCFLLMDKYRCISGKGVRNKQFFRCNIFFHYTFCWLSWNQNGKSTSIHKPWKHLMQVKQMAYPTLLVPLEVKYSMWKRGRRSRRKSKVEHTKNHPILRIWDMADFLLNSKYAYKLLGCDIRDASTWKSEVLNFWDKFRCVPWHCLWV